MLNTILFIWSICLVSEAVARDGAPSFLLAVLGGFFAAWFVWRIEDGR